MKCKMPANKKTAGTIKPGNPGKARKFGPNPGKSKGAR